MSLKLELKSDNKVLVTNLQNNQQKEVTLRFLQRITNDSLVMLCQYKTYELIINTEKYWNRIQGFNSESHKIKNAVSKNSFQSHSIPNNPSSLSLKLELKLNNDVLVTNLKTNEQKEVTLKFLQKITGNSLSMLVQYNCYELVINAEQYWNIIKRFDRRQEDNENMDVEQKFQNIMGSNSYSSTGNKAIDNAALLAAGSGAVTGVLVNGAMGNVGVAAMGTAIGVGAAGFATVGAVAGCALYGFGKALK